MSEKTEISYWPRLRGAGALFSLAALSTLLLTLALPIIGARAAEPATTPFAKTWERPDYPVATGQANRTWMWGPEAFTEALIEDYWESPGRERTVQYYDKSRMEITDPNGDPASDWYVTNGLLVVELVSGRMQTGDNRFEDRNPASVNVAGDDDDPTGPTYRTISYVLDEPARDEGELIVERIDRSGGITTDNRLADYGITAERYVAETGHTVAAPFWAFMNTTGTVYRDGQYVTDTLFPTPYYATGLPIAEAYWAEVKVGGEYKDVLMQCFERRCLTYTPDNPSGWQVEAGNVGLHYYAWRYGSSEPTPNPDPDPSPTPTPDPDPEPDPEPNDPVDGDSYEYQKSLGNKADDRNKLEAPYGVAVAPDGNIVVVDNEKHRVQIYSPEGFWIGGFGGDSSYGSFDHKDVEIDKNGYIWILDTKNHRVVGFDSTGRKRGEIGVPGSGNGQLNSPEAFTISPNGWFYIADTGNARVQVFDNNGQYVRGWGQSGQGDGEFLAPTGIAVDAAGNVHVADGRAHRVQKFNSNGAYQTKWGGEGALQNPAHMTIDKNGYLYVADYGNNRVQVFTTDGEPVRTFGSSGSQPGKFNGPVDIAADGNGNIYVADLKNHRIQKFTWRGDYLDSWSDDRRSTFEKPYGADLSEDGYLFVVDTAHKQVKVFDDRGNFAGAIYAKFAYPVDVAVYGEYVYVLDAGQNYVFVFEIYRTFSDKHLEFKLYDYFGDPGDRPDQLDEPTSIALDGDGYVYVVSGNDTIVKFTWEGEYVTHFGDEELVGPLAVAAYGEYVYVTDFERHVIEVYYRSGEHRATWGGPGAEPGYFEEPTDIDVDTYGYVYVIDSGNTRIQKLSPQGAHVTTVNPANSGGPSFFRPVGLAVGNGDTLYVVSDTQAAVLLYSQAS